MTCKIYVKNNRVALIAKLNELIGVGRLNPSNCYQPPNHMPASSTTHDKQDAFPQTTKLKKWVESERANGLKDIKFFKANTAASTLESFSGEVNQMLEAPVISHKDLF